MKTQKWTEVRRTRLSPERIAENTRWAEQEILELNLREIRETVGRTQVDTAEAAEMSQSELSKFERREDHLLSTLRRYVSALGGELEVVAVFGNRRVKLTGV